MIRFARSHHLILLEVLLTSCLTGVPSTHESGDQRLRGGLVGVYLQRGCLIRTSWPRCSRHALHACSGSRGRGAVMDLVASSPSAGRARLPVPPRLAWRLQQTPPFNHRLPALVDAAQRSLLHDEHSESVARSGKPSGIRYESEGRLEDRPRAAPQMYQDKMV